MNYRKCDKQLENVINILFFSFIMELEHWLWIKVNKVEPSMANNISKGRIFYETKRTK